MTMCKFLWTALVYSTLFDYDLLESSFAPIIAKILRETAISIAHRSYSQCCRVDCLKCPNLAAKKSRNKPAQVNVLEPAAFRPNSGKIPPNNQRNGFHFSYMHLKSSWLLPWNEQKKKETRAVYLPNGSTEDLPPPPPRRPTHKHTRTLPRTFIHRTRQNV